MPVTIPDHLVSGPKPSLNVDDTAQAMINAAIRNPGDGSFVVSIPKTIDLDDPVVKLIWTAIDEALIKRGIQFTISTFRDAGRARRYHPEVPAREA